LFPQEHENQAERAQRNRRANPYFVLQHEHRLLSRSRIASRMTANASCPTSSFVAM
jgi:hypothetical protein